MKKLKKKSSKKAQDKATGTGYKRGALRTALFTLFDKKGVDEVTYEQAEAAAKKAKPDTAFNAQHFAWYKNAYKNLD